MAESTARGDFQGSVCPHDCPSTCALEVEVLRDAGGVGRGIGTVRGAAANSYTAGVICAKVARYAERVHHPGRLLKPLLRTGPKGSGQFREIGFEEALDRVAAVRHLPTVNGISTFNPPHWPAGIPEDPGYLPAVEAYARAWGVTGLCALDLRRFAWSGPEDR